jgi:PAS domain S-box-containing protein
MNRVLLVDDKEENIYYLQALLTAHGWVVETARHGAEALIKARQRRPDLVVSDLLMPVMDGYTLLRHWKADSRLKNAPFIVYTATYTEEEDEQLALNLGADAFILKPSEPEIFLARMRAVLDARLTAQPAAASLPAGDEREQLKIYSETLIRKLEEKTLQLEELNQALQQDIAERKKAEERISEQAALLEQTQDAILVRDLEQRIVYWNKGAERIYGWSAAEAMGRSVRDLIYPDVGQLVNAMEILLRHGEWSGELRHMTKAGGEVIIEGRWTLLRDAAGRPKSVLAINTDVTERKKIEAQFLRAQRLESIGTLAGGIAHDLNNLLAPIVMGVELLRMRENDPGTARVIDTIDRSARRGTDLVKQVLSFARGVEGARVAVHLGHIVREIEGITQTTFPKSISFHSDIPKDIRLVQGDPTQLNQVLLNLCVNARDAMAEGGRLTIKVRDTEIDESAAAMYRETVKPGHYVCLEVSDTGCGMTPEHVERLFEPFFTTKAPGKGTGLGLSTVLGIVRSHGGFLQVQSEKGRGSTFKVYLPAQVETQTEADPVRAADSLPRGRGELVLVVDDESAIADITRQTLEAFGYRVITAGDGAEAMGLFALHRQEVALVLTDMMMPVMDGAALIAALHRISPEVRIIAASGISADGPEGRALNAGVRHFLAKPYTAEMLLCKINEALQAG